MKARLLRGVGVLATAVAVFLGGTPARADELAGKGSIGVALGAMRFTGGEDLSSGAGIRPMMRLMFKYAWERHLVSDLETGYGWNAYGEGGDYKGNDLSVGTLAVATPVTFGLDYRFDSSNPKIVPRFGGGLGAYSFSVRAGRDRVSRDPANNNRRARTTLGFYGKVGSELLVHPSMVLNADVLWHYSFAKDADRFPSGYFDSNISFAEFRFGINYYFKIRSTGAAPTKPNEGDEE